MRWDLAVSLAEDLAVPQVDVAVAEIVEAVLVADARSNY